MYFIQERKYIRREIETVLRKSPSIVNFRPVQSSRRGPEFIACNDAIIIDFKLQNGLHEHLVVSVLVQMV